DIHGNVHTLVQDQPDLAAFGNQLKTLEYSYDLISGNTQEVRYQPNAADQFTHRYAYDADNRLETVHTSLNGVVWERDADYKYYDHGPLERTQLGDVDVQGSDYTYTLHGWLKGVNANTLRSARDPGQDGEIGNGYQSGQAGMHRQVARDAYGFSLGYYDGDYSAIDGGAAAFLATQAGSHFKTAQHFLYNGNISHLVNALSKPDETEMAVHGYAFTYDQLNRLKDMETYTHNDLSASNSFAPAGGFGGDAPNPTDYKVELAYDANGNITTLKRNGYAASGNLAMDDFTYRYKTDVAGNLVHNRLALVNDPTPAGHYGVDIDEQDAGGTFDPNSESTWNYTYDEIGQLLEDKAEEIANIDWNPYHKVTRVTRTATSTKSDLEFLYDASGNRIAKRELPRTGSGLATQDQWVTTFYGLDAGGRIMTTYRHFYVPNGSDGQGNLLFQENYAPTEAMLYGSGRLGTTNPNRGFWSRQLTVSATYNPDGTFNILTAGAPLLARESKVQSQDDFSSPSPGGGGYPGWVPIGNGVPAQSGGTLTLDLPGTNDGVIH
ncbi:MAG: hypothetical protein AAGB22_10190, partial [Bacteroidota bacterium]